MNDSEKPAIEVKNLTKSFKIPLDKSRSIKQTILGRATRGYRTFSPLNGLSFTINKGDFFGIVGRNGSGKSTLLKTVAGIYAPETGKVEVDGTLVPFIELGVGFNPQLSGRENVYLSAALLGFSRPEISEMYDEIVDFSELHDFMEERLQNYSSGMQVRLAFSISIFARGDILLLDEVLAVGDAAFQQKCYDYFEQLKRDNKTVVLVTHSMNNIERFCNRAMLLNDGKVEYIGDPEEVANRYKQLFIKTKNDKSQVSAEASDLEIDISKVELIQDGKKTKNIKALKPFTAKFSIKALRTMGQVNPVLNIEDFKGNMVYISDVYFQNKEFVDIAEGETVDIEYRIEDNIYTNGSYSVYTHVNIDDDDGGRRKARILTMKSTMNISGITNNDKSMVHPGTSVKVVRP